jgi:hypothetical protein
METPAFGIKQLWYIACPASQAFCTVARHHNSPKSQELEGGPGRSSSGDFKTNRLRIYNSTETNTHLNKSAEIIDEGD